MDPIKSDSELERNFRRCLWRSIQFEGKATQDRFTQAHADAALLEKLKKACLLKVPPDFLMRPAAERLGLSIGRSDVQPNPGGSTSLKDVPAPAESEGKEPDRSADRIGKYRLLGKIGEGGCGIVYAAEQEPIRRRVALKIIKLGMDTRDVIARFESERHALAKMDHPNIARVFDAGSTGTGRPYFVMELVEGCGITEYCDANQLSSKERIRLFIQVCHAVEHAHQKGIIHRDLKPSNILVAAQQGNPVPKVIDFGIARAVEGRLTERTVHTELYRFLGTPVYMSPEQATRKGLDKTTDVYSLGVLLYELLVGTPPFSADELSTAGPDEMCRIIDEEEPPRPSVRFATLKRSEQSSISERRGCSPQTLIQALQGDIDWIIMKCLEKDRGRRYERADALAEDLQRYLDSHPVIARPPNVAYKLWKMWGRNSRVLATHKALLSAVGLPLLLLVGGLVWLAALGNKMDAARIKTHLLEASERAFQADLAAALRVPGPEEQRQLRESAEAARQTRHSLIEGLAMKIALVDQQPGASPILKTMAVTLENQGVNAAIAYVERKRPEILNQTPGEDLDSAQARVRLQPLLQMAMLREAKGDLAEARADYHEALGRQPDWPEALDGFVWFLWRQSRQATRHGSLRAAFADAEACLRTASHWYALRPAISETQRAMAAAHEQMGAVLAARRAEGDTQLAAEHFEKSLAMSNPIYEANPTSIEAARDLAETLTQLGDLLSDSADAQKRTEALNDYQRALEIRELILTANPWSKQATREVGLAVSRMGDTLSERGQMGDPEQALRYYQRDVALSEQLFAAQPHSSEAARDLAVALRKLGNILKTASQTGDREEALVHYERSLKISERLFSENPQSVEAARDTATSLKRVAESLADRMGPGDADKALAHYERSLKINEQLLAANPDSAEAARDVSVSLNKLAGFLTERGEPGDVEKALPYYKRDLEISERLFAANPESGKAASDVVLSHYTMFRYYRKLGQEQNAMASLKAGLEILDSFDSHGRIIDAEARDLRAQMRDLLDDAK